MNDTIQIFASDHRMNTEWHLPFIRILHTSNVINLASDEFLDRHKDLMSEPAKMLFAWKHIEDFGNPNYIGFCHYRRYFAICKDQPYQSRIVVEDPTHKLSSCIMSPIDQLFAMKNAKVDGILEFPFLDTVDANKYQTVVDMFNNVINTMPGINAQNHCPLNISPKVINYWVEEFEKRLPAEFKPYFKDALASKLVYHSNIFTARKNICSMYFQLLESLVIDVVKFVDDNQIQMDNSRWLAYIIEYLFSNVFFHLMIMSRKFKFAHCQLLVQ